MDDPYKLPLPTIPHKTMAVHGTPRSALMPPPSPRSCQAAAAAAMLATASEVLLPRFRRRCRLRFHRHRRCRFRRRCRRCIQLIVDCCLCPRHRCHRRCLHHHPGGAWRQNGGCRGHARRRRVADAMPAVAAAAALPASCRCRRVAAATTATALPPHFPPRRCRR